LGSNFIWNGAKSLILNLALYIAANASIKKHCFISFEQIVMAISASGDKH